MKEKTIKENVYRIKKMNAIETLALQSSISFDSIKDIMKSYKDVLERVEVKFNNNWLPVKEEGKEVYYPAGIEDNLEELKEVIKFFLDYIKEVFQLSNV